MGSLHSWADERAREREMFRCASLLPHHRQAPFGILSLRRVTGPGLALLFRRDNTGTVLLSVVIFIAHRRRLAFGLRCCVPAAGADTRRQLCSSSRQRLAVLRYRLSTYGRRAFSVASPIVCNSLPDFFRDPTISADCFRRLLKTYLFARYYCTNGPRFVASPLCSARDEEGALTAGRRWMLACRQCLQHAGPSSSQCALPTSTSALSLVAVPSPFLDSTCVTRVAVMNMHIVRCS